VSSASATNQPVARDKDEVEQHLDRGLRQRRLLDHPADLDPAVVAEQSFDRGARFTRVDRIAEPARCAERQAKEFELVGGGFRAFAQQIDATRAHVGVGLVG